MSVSCMFCCHYILQGWKKRLLPSDVAQPSPRHHNSRSKRLLLIFAIVGVSGLLHFQTYHSKETCLQLLKLC